MDSGWASIRAVPQFLRQRPGVAFALLLILGIALGGVVAVKPLLWLGMAAGFLVLTIVSRRVFVVGAAIVFVGISAAQIARFQFPTDSIGNFATDTQRLAQIEARIDDPPRLLLSSPAELRLVPPKQTATASVRAVRTTSGWEEASGRVAITIEEPNILLRAGQTVRMIGMLQRPDGAMNPGEFDYAAWCRQQRILATVRVSHAEGVQILAEPWPQPMLWLRRKTRDLLAEGFDERQTYDQTLLRAFVLGDSDPELADLDSKFVRTGMVHYLVVSGLHVAIVGEFTLLICRLLRRSPRTSAMIALGVVVFYAMVANPTWPGWRSIILCASATAGLLFRRAVDGLHNFALGVAAVLLIHPADLGEGGFQVSCAAVLGFILFAGMVEKRFWSWWQGPDPGPMNIRRGTVRAVARAAFRWMMLILIGGCVAWAMCFPLIAYHFNQLNFWSVPAGVVILPLTIVAMAGGIAKIVLTLLWPSGAHLWATMACGPVSLMHRAIEFLDRLPGASMTVAPPAIGLIVAYYVLIALCFVPIRGVVFRWSARAVCAAACVVFFLAPGLAGGAALAADRGGLHIALLSVGEGQAAIIEPRAGHAVFVDDGSETISDVGRGVILPYLRFEDDGHVDKIFLSECDFDQISGTGQILGEYGSPAVFASPQFAQLAEANFAAQSLVRLLERTNHPAANISRGDHVDLGNGATVEVLWPPADCDMTSVNCGLVLKLKFAGASVLFTADIEEPAQRALLKHSEELRADVLIAPHYGSAEASTAAFLLAVHPRFVFASSGEKLTRKQRLFDILAKNYSFYRTGECGAIDLTIGGGGQIGVKTFLTTTDARSEK
jgi:competence protein ComEC